MRWFFDAQTLTTGQEVQMKGEEAKHISKVLRLQVGDQIAVIDGEGHKANCELLFVSPKMVSYVVRDWEELANHNPYISVVISPTKQMQRIEYAIEKITEIGVRHIYILITDNTQRKQVNVDRLEKKVIAALKQSQQSWKPQIRLIHTMDQIEEDYAYKYVAYAEEHSTLDIKTTEHSVEDKIVIAIGPEGDFTTAELQDLFRRGFKQVRLGPNRLRTETAVVYATTALHSSIAYDRN